MTKPLKPSFWQSTFFVKLLHWEYWPTYLVYAPVAFIYAYFALRARKLFFFSAVNPVIETGGVFGESKINILNRIPQAYLPTTIFIAKENKNLKYILGAIEKANINFPFIAKPDVGERGFLVEIIKNKPALLAYLKTINADFIIQDLVDTPLELSVLYYRMPDAQKGKITSVCIKRKLFVIGDGQSTVEELMLKKPRARLQLARFQKQYPERLIQMPKVGEEVELEPIGNHSRGTTFVNANQHIDKQLEAVFDKIGFQMENIYYGRFDFKCQSFEHLKRGETIKILEFNGVAGEPAHIYDPEYPLWKSYRDLYQHFKIIFKIGQAQSKKGVPSMTFKELKTSYKAYNDYLATAKI